MPPVVVSPYAVSDANWRQQVSLAFGQLSTVRETMAADVNYYVSATGNDANDGLTTGNAFATIQRALDTIYGRLDLNGHVVILNVADGTYTGAISLSGILPGASAGQPLRIIGNETTPANVVIAPASGTTLSMDNYAYLLLAGVTLQNTAGTLVSTAGGAILEHRNCVFGTAGNEKFLCAHRSVVRALGDFSVSGNSVSFVHSTKRSIWDLGGHTMTFVGGPVFSTYLWGLNDASVDLDSGTIVGTATGPTLVHDSAILNVSSTTGQWWGVNSTITADDGGIIAAADVAATRNYYVRPGGNDKNPGLFNTDAGAFKTLQGAVDALAKQAYNPIQFSAGNGLTIICQGNTYGETITLRDVKAEWVMILGDETTPSNVTIAGVTHGLVATGVRTPWIVRGAKITATAGDAIHAEQGSQVTFRNCEFGAASLAQLCALSNSRVTADGPYKISGSAGYHFFSRGCSVIDFNGISVTLTGIPAFSTAYGLAELGGVVRALGATFTGSATGSRYSLKTNGVIDTNGGGATFLPGNAAGSAVSGGQYV